MSTNGQVRGIGANVSATSRASAAGDWPVGIHSTWHLTCRHRASPPFCCAGFLSSAAVSAIKRYFLYTTPERSTHNALAVHFYCRRPNSITLSSSRADSRPARELDYVMEFDLMYVILLCAVIIVNFINSCSLRSTWKLIIKIVKNRRSDNKSRYKSRLFPQR